MVNQQVSDTGARTVRRRLIVVAITLMLAAIGIVLLPSTITHLKSGGMTADSAESVRAERLVSENFPAASPDLVLILTPTAGPAGARQTVAEVAALPAVSEVHSYFTDTPAPELSSGDSGLAFVSVPGDSPADVLEVAHAARDIGAAHGVTVAAGGDRVIDGSIDELAEESLVRAELIAAPIVGLILLVTFGSVWAALIPLVAGGAAVAISMLALNLLARVTDVSTFALNLATAIGFGLAVDYSLFIIARWREGRLRGMTAEQARALTARTSGRTIAFSAITVVISMAALLIFPGYFLKSLAYSGIITVTTVMIVTVALVPGVLVLLGDRATRRYRWSRWASVEFAPAVTTDDVEVTAPSRLRVWISAILVTAALIAVAAPFLGANFILRDYRELPVDDLGRQGSEQLVADYPALADGAALIAFPSAPEAAELNDLAESLARIDHVAAVRWSGGTITAGTGAAPATAFDRSLFSGSDGQRWIRVSLSADPESPAAADTVRLIRAQVGPRGGLVGGPTATLIDSNHDIASKLPYAIAVIVVVTAVLLFLLTGSILLPIIGVVLSVLSLGATFGLLVLVFQDGNFADVLGGFTAFGAINVSAPILLFCIAYGLSMDYQMFILARIAEEHAAGRDSEGAIRSGLGATRRVIGAAALLIAVVLTAMATSELTYLKILGVGLGVAVLVDAFIVRLFLLPNAMRIFGDLVWYRPSWLDAVYRRLQLSHGDH